jgi:hypothetical protein
VLDAFDHDEMTRLLPWYVNGTLDDDERAAVEKHVRDCLPCRATLREQRRLATLVRRDVVADLSVEGNFERLLPRLDTKARAQKSFFAGFRRAHYAAAAAALVAIVAGALWTVSITPELDYATLTEGGQATRPRLDVLFADGTTEPEMRALIRGVGGIIVDGPSDIGRYTIELDRSEIATEDFDRLITTLRDDPRVRFAGPSFISPEAGPR